MTLFLTLLHHPSVERIGWTLLHFIWEGAAIALLLALALRLLAAASANLRYWISCAAMLLLALAPLITFYHLPRNDVPFATAAPIHALPLSQDTPPRPIPFAADPAPIPEPTLAIRLRTLLQPTLPSLVLVWMVGVVGLSLWHLAGWIQVRRLKRRGTHPLDPAWQTRLSRLAHRLHLHRPVLFLESLALQVPAVVGWFRPAILIPTSALAGLTPQQLDAIIAHELAHIRRHDYLVNLLQVIAETLLFYHPATWWISRQIRLERENCCDDLATALCGDRLLYAQSLATLEELRSMSTQLVLSARGGLLLRRIQRLLAPSSARPRPRLWPIAIVLAALACLFLPFVTTRLRAADPKPSDPPTSQPIPSPILPEDLVAVPTDYVIGRNDLITVSILDLVNAGVETLRTVRVSETGLLSLPLLPKPIKSAGRTELQLQKDIIEAYRDATLFPNAQVSVAVTEARQRTFTILGNVQRSGTYPMTTSDFSLIDALAAAGGLNPGADKIYVTRDAHKQNNGIGKPASRRVIEVPVRELLAGDPHYNIIIRGRDQITVPEAIISPATQPSSAPASPLLSEDYHPGDMRDYVIGPSDDVVVIVIDPANRRSPDGRPLHVDENGMLALPLQLGTIKAAGRTAQQLQKEVMELARKNGIPSDAPVSVSVAEPRQWTFTVYGNVEKPGAYPIPRAGGISLIDALTMAGGLNYEVDKLHIIRKADGQDRTIEIPASELVAGNPRCNIVVRRGDRIMVPKVDPPSTTQPAVSGGLKAICYFGGPIEMPGAYTLSPGAMTLRQLVSRARISQSFKGEPAIELGRREGNAYFHLGRPIPLRQLMDGIVADIPLKNNDMVMIVPLSESKPPATQPKGE
ncbi:MAG: M56 family metallopeptidase [Bacillota bacterium]